MGKKFNGVVNLDVRDSVADWTPFREPFSRSTSPPVGDDTYIDLERDLRAGLARD